MPISLWWYHLNRVVTIQAFISFSFSFSFCHFAFIRSLHLSVALSMLLVKLCTWSIDRSNERSANNDVIKSDASNRQDWMNLLFWIDRFNMLHCTIKTKSSLFNRMICWLIGWCSLFIFHFEKFKPKPPLPSNQLHHTPEMQIYENHHNATHPWPLSETQENYQNSYWIEWINNCSHLEFDLWIAQKSTCWMGLLS